MNKIHLPSLVVKFDAVSELVELSDEDECVVVVSLLVTVMS